MTDARSDRTLKLLLELEADALPARPDASARPDLPVESFLPGLDERVDMFLEAVHGAEHEYAAQARAAAREHILDAMASDLAEHSSGSASLPAAPLEPAPQAARSADRVPSVLDKLAAGWRQAVAASANVFSPRGMRLAAVPLVALLAVGTIWSTRSIYLQPAPKPATMRAPGAGADLPPAPSPPTTRGLAPSPEAEEALRRRIFSAESALGPSHPDIAEMLASLASLYQSQERHVEAEALYERVLAVRERALGPRHPALVATMNQLAEVYRARGRVREAQDLSARAASISKP